MSRGETKARMLGLLYDYVARVPRADHFTVYPGDPTEVIVYKLLDGPGGNERGRMPIVQGTLEQVLIYMRGEAG